jgi:hypothetical protein
MKVSIIAQTGHLDLVIKLQRVQSIWNRLAQLEQS